MCVPEFSMSPDLLGPNFDDYHVVVHDVPDVGRQASEAAAWTPTDTVLVAIAYLLQMD